MKKTSRCIKTDNWCLKPKSCTQRGERGDRGDRGERDASGRFRALQAHVQKALLRFSTFRILVVNQTRPSLSNQLHSRKFTPSITDEISGMCGRNLKGQPAIFSPLTGPANGCGSDCGGRPWQTSVHLRAASRRSDGLFLEPLRIQVWSFSFNFGTTQDEDTSSAHQSAPSMETSQAAQRSIPALIDDPHLIFCFLTAPVAPVRQQSALNRDKNEPH